MTLLVVDGMDRCGKDSLVRGLVARRQTSKPLHTFHNVAPPKGFSGEAARRYHLELYATQFLMVQDYDAHDFIVNRSWLSEQVYGYMYRHQPANLPHEWMHEVATMLRQMPHLVVTLVDEAEQVLARSDGDSTFDKVDGARLPHVKEERVQFHHAYKCLEHFGISRKLYDGVHPNKVVEDVAGLLGW